MRSCSPDLASAVTDCVLVTLSEALVDLDQSAGHDMNDDAALVAQKHLLIRLLRGLTSALFYCYCLRYLAAFACP